MPQSAAKRQRAWLPRRPAVTDLLLTALVLGGALPEGYSEEDLRPEKDEWGDTNPEREQGYRKAKKWLAFWGSEYIDGPNERPTVADQGNQIARYGKQAPWALIVTGAEHGWTDEQVVLAWRAGLTVSEALEYLNDPAKAAQIASLAALRRS